MKVLLADDEYLIREGLQSAIDWKAHGMEIVGAAEDGEQALELFRQRRPDLIITDICMPFLDGLQLAEAVLREDAGTRVILLTCYDEFEYAKQAVKIGVLDYVLKPIDLGYMDQMLGGIAEKFRAEQARTQQAERQRLFSEVLHRQKGLEDGAERQRCAGLCGREQYACMIVGILGYRLAKDTFEEAELQEYFQQFAGLVRSCAGETEFFEPSAGEGRVTMVLAGDSAQQAASRMQEICAAMRRDEALTNEYPFLCATDGVAEGLEKLQTAYAHCQAVMRYDYLSDETTVLDYALLRRKTQEDNGRVAADIANFASCVRTFDRGLIERSMGGITQTIRESGRYSTMYGQMFVAAAYSQLIGALEEFDIRIEEVFADPAEEYRKVIVAGSLQKQIDGLGRMLGAVCDYVQGQKGSAHRTLVEAARQYIDAHYAENTISLQSVAAEVHMSACYFSILFKQESGRSFISYLTELRMERAKHLLRRTDLKAYEIAGAVGYDNPTYFSTLFKKHTDLSPKEYRQQFIEKAEE